MTKPRTKSTKPTFVPAVEEKIRRWASITAAAEHYQIGTRTLRQMIYDRKVTGYRLGPQLLRVDLNEIDALMIPTQGGAE